MKNKSGYNYFLQRNRVLGTSIVPKGKARVEQEAKNAQATSNYIEAKKTNVSARKQIVEMRVDFIPFEYEGTKVGTNQEKHDAFVEALATHDTHVRNAIKKLTKESKKRYGIPDDATIELYQGVRKIERTSYKVSTRSKVVNG